MAWWVMFDVFFISHGELVAERNWQILRTFAPMARRVVDIKGIHAAHHRCAELSRTSNFFVVDADCQIVNHDFTAIPSSYDIGYVHLWYARNPVNGLEYGWGGVKLFPKEAVLDMRLDSLDMTGSFELKIIPNTTSITCFDSDNNSAWRSAFRECAKLSQNEDDDSQYRLSVWNSVAIGPMADACRLGAQQGSEYGIKHAGDKDALLRINDYEWLNERFRECEDLI